MRQLVHNATKLLKTGFGEKIDLTLGPIIAGTECDRDKPIFSPE